MIKPSDKPYTVEIFQNGTYVQWISTYAPSPNSARLKALRMFREDNKGSKGITAVTK